MGNEEIEKLAWPLPEDIQKLKWGGDFETLEKVLAERIRDARTPDVLKKRLKLELALSARIPREYPYSWEEALAILRASIRDFADGELTALWGENVCDWIYWQGKIRFSERLLENLLKTKPEYAARSLDQTTVNEQQREEQLLNDNISLMREQGGRGMRMHLKTRLTLTEAAAARCKGKTLRVYLPLPVSGRQVLDFRLHRLQPKPIAVAGLDYPQRTAVFEAVCSGEAGADVFETDFSLDTFTPYAEPDAARVLKSQPTFYTEEQLPHMRFTPYLRALAAEIVGEERNPLLKAWKLYDYITEHVRYSFMRSYATVYDIPEYTAANLKGDCGFQALLFITLCRIVGVPARWQSGLYATPDEVGAHDWAEYYVAPYGWLFADPSFGGAAFREGDLARRAFYRCNIDPYRIPYASEFQHDFLLPAPGLRNDPYDNQSGEVFCEDKALLFGEFRVERTLELVER